MAFAAKRALIDALLLMIGMRYRINMSLAGTSIRRGPHLRPASVGFAFSSLPVDLRHPRDAQPAQINVH